MPVSFDLTSEQEELRKLSREFAQREIIPIAAEIDEKDETPFELVRKMAQPPYRWTGLFIPREYGGFTRPILDTCIITEELGAASPVGVVLLEIVGLGTGPINIAGSEGQKRKYLPPIARGEEVCCFALTEPGTGSDAAAIEARAQLVGDHYVLNGRKRYISYASVSSFATVFAKTDPNLGSRGISAFIVERGTPGFSVVEKNPCIGLKGHQDEEVELRNCRIPREDLIGEEGKGLRYGLATFDDTRLTLAAGFIGLARVALEAAVKFAAARKAFGRSLVDNQAISFPLADIAIGIEAARLLIYKGAWLAEQGIRHTMETAQAKSLASEVMLKATDHAITVYGGFGCTKRFPIERYYRDARIWTFAQGAPNIMKLIVARELLRVLANYSLPT